MKSQQINLLIKLVYLLIPVFLIIFVYNSIGVHLPPQTDHVYKPDLELITKWRSLVIYCLFFYSGNLIFFKLFKNKITNIPKKTLFIGIILTLLSYGIGGFLVDLNYLLYFIKN